MFAFCIENILMFYRFMIFSSMNACRQYCQYANPTTILTAFICKTNILSASARQWILRKSVSDTDQNMQSSGHSLLRNNNQLCNKYTDLLILASRVLI